MRLSPELAALTEFLGPVDPARIVSQGNAGGMSGAAIWRVFAASHELHSEYCLRRWPLGHPSWQRLGWIHQQLQRVADRGFTIVPRPISSRSGSTIVRVEGHLWELTTWMPGCADFDRNPSDARLAAAMSSLARFHLASRDDPNAPPDRSAGIEFRRSQLENLDEGVLSRLRQQVDERHGCGIRDLCLEILHGVPHRLAAARRLVQEVHAAPTPIQPCLRDIWHDHVLFTGERVTGIVDFGAMRIDSPAGDLARLIGSLARDDASRWQAALSDYARVRPLANHELRLVAAFDRANVILSGLNWIRWLYDESREFDEMSRVERRLGEFATRLATPQEALWQFPPSR